ncbi:MAG: efflux RND transporter periplasmic adaptor subunit [Bryobacterales bacterium]
MTSCSSPVSSTPAAAAVTPGATPTPAPAAAETVAKASPNAAGDTAAAVAPTSPQPPAAGENPSQAASGRAVRSTGTIQAVRYLLVQTPRISGRNSRLTLVALVPNGAMVKEGEPLAEFDHTEQLEAGREAQAKYDDLSHQVEQKKAENDAEQAKRRLDQREAESELKEARIQLRKGPLLSEIDRLKNETKAQAAEQRVASLQQSDRHRVEAEAAALRVLELQRDRQQVALERAQNNVSKLLVRAPLSGMAAHEAIWRNGSMGPPQEGDQLYSGQALMRIFDPSAMEVQARIAEPDGAVLKPGCRAIVSLDAYPELEFTARLESASPVAASAIGSPIKTFLARFRLEQTDPHLLPDLSAAVVIPMEQP